jgi:hypothetical protein
MRFNPLPEQDFMNDKANITLQPGEYAFEIIAADDYVSKAGNPGIKLMVEVIDNTIGQKHYLTDYLSSAAIFKIHQFCKAVGLLKQYEQGELDPVYCIGKKAKVQVALEKGKPKDDGSGACYTDRMAVKKYIVNKSTSASTATTPAATEVAPFPDDDVPF